MMFKATNKAAWDAFAATFPVDAEILIDEIGPIVTTPAVIDSNGNITKPAVVDNAHHVNIRIQRPILNSADNNDTVDVYEELVSGATGVQWIDPSTVATPHRVWL